MLQNVTVKTDEERFFTSFRMTTVNRRRLQSGAAFGVWGDAVAPKKV
jgi:hypothetical protein